MKDIKEYKCFIASPSDTSLERESCDKVIEDINSSMGSFFGFRIVPLKWENNVHPAIGADAQAVINDQIGKDYDIFIGIMYKRFGAPTPRAGSGTEEEFKRAIDYYRSNNNVEIMLYFNNKASNMNEIDPEQFLLVKAFKQSVEKEGCLYCTYDGHEEFANLLRKHLLAYFSKRYGPQSETEKSIHVATILEDRFNKSLEMFDDQPQIWVEPVLYEGELLTNPDETYDKKVSIGAIIENPQSYIITAPSLFGLSSLSHYLVLSAWKDGNHGSRLPLSAFHRKTSLCTGNSC